MRIASAFGIVLVAAAKFANGAEQVMTPGQVFEAASPSVVVVNGLDLAGTPTMQGSGVVIAPGVVVSNCHVFKSAKSARVLFRDEALPATLRHMDTERDLCSFTVTGLSASPTRLGDTKSLHVGDRVYAIGAPRGLDLTLSDGLISSLRAIEGGALLQVTAPISPGSSGGGLFDSAGRLVGITTMQWKESQQLNFAVPIEWVTELPRRDAKRRKELAETQTAATLPAAQERGRLALNALGIELEAADPAGYASKHMDLRAAVLRIKGTSPPDEWANAARRAYYAIPSKARSSTPVLTAGAPAIYPAHVAAAGIGGTTSLVISLDTHGVPIEVQVEKSSKNSDLDQAAVNAAWGWRFSPGIADWAPIPSRVRIPVDFAPPVREEGVVTKESSRWIMLTKTSEESLAFDLHSAEYVAGIATFWLRTIYTPPQTVSSYEGIAREVQQIAFDCARKTLQLRAATIYSKTGEVVNAMTTPRDGWSPIAPETIHERIFLRICKGG